MPRACRMPWDRANRDTCRTTDRVTHDPPCLLPVDDVPDDAEQIVRELGRAGLLAGPFGRGSTN